MAFSIHYLGHIQVRPALNEAEFAYLTAFGEMIHEAGSGSPYEVPDNPLAPRHDADSGLRVLEPRDDLPDVICSWVPSCGGECLVVNGDSGDHRRAREWLEFLYDHFLRPGAKAASSGLPDFEEFTFDHTLDSVVAAHRSDSGRLWLIRADDGEISEEVVWWGESP